MSEERFAYEELRPGTEVQPGDQYRNTQGRWVEYSMDTSGVPTVGPTTMARRPHNITALEKYRGDLIGDIEHVIGERDEACRERDLARAEVARLSTELWARKPLEERVASLVDELAQARAEIQNLLKTITGNADQFVDQVTVVEQQRDEARAERDRLQDVVSNLYGEPTARQVQDMLRTWATELDWSAGCFDSVAREQIDTIQKTLIAVIERIETVIHPEGGTDGE